MSLHTQLLRGLLAMPVVLVLLVAGTLAAKPAAPTCPRAQVLVAAPAFDVGDATLLGGRIRLARARAH